MNPRTPASSSRPSMPPTRPRDRRGTILIVVMLVIAALAGMVLSLGRATRVEAMASANRASAARAAAAERAAEQYVLSLLARDRATVMTLDEKDFINIPVGGTGVFWIVRPDYGDNNLPAYGLVDEASKLNINAATREMLAALVVMPDELPDSIIDWRDEDGDISGDGAEDQYYLNLRTPYRCKNSAFETVEELLLVRGAYPQLLYGDRSRGPAGGVAGASGMQVGGLSEEELRARGLMQYVTVFSREPNAEGGPRPPRGRINVNTAPREVLRCLPGLTDQDAGALVSRRASDFGETDMEWFNEVLGTRRAALGPVVTGESYQFTADIVAASTDGRAFRRVRVVIDAADVNNTPRVIYRRDLTDDGDGWPLDRDILTALRDGTWAAGQRS